MIPENEPGAGVSSGEDRQTLPRSVEIRETFKPQMLAVCVLDQDVVERFG